MRKALFAAICLVACADNIPAPVTGDAPAKTKASCDTKTINTSTKPPPAGWSLRGHVTLRATGGQLVSADASDATGKASVSHPLAAQSKEALIDAIRAAVCDAGGLVAAPNPKSPPETDIQEQGALLDTFGPDEPNAQADVDALCDATTPPSDRPIRDLAAAHDRFVWLTTPEWRRLQLGAEESLASQADKASMHAAAKEQAKLINDAASKAGKARCWYAEILNAFGDAP